jgi:hypothetical protein
MNRRPVSKPKSWDDKGDSPTDGTIAQTDEAEQKSDDENLGTGGSEPVSES